MKGPKCTTHTQEETRAGASPLGNPPSLESGSASNVAKAYPATKSRMTQNGQPMGFEGGRWGAITAPTGEKLTAITVFTDLSTDT
jgi:hypothetical protein